MDLGIDGFSRDLDFDGMSMDLDLDAMCMELDSVHVSEPRVRTAADAGLKDGLPLKKRRTEHVSHRTFRWPTKSMMNPPRWLLGPDRNE